MGSVTLPVAAYIAAGATVVGTAVSAYESHEAGVATANADKRKARVEAENATQKQIGMRQNMLRALATQSASAGVGGTGVNKATALRQISQGEDDLLVNKSNSSAQTSLLDQAAGNAISSGNLGALADVAGGVSKLAGSGLLSGSSSTPSGNKTYYSGDSGGG